VDKFVPVDIYIPGRPDAPGTHRRPDQVAGENRPPIHPTRWYQKGPDAVEILIPVLGPDLMDPRRYADIKKLAAQGSVASTTEAASAQAEE
jgi:NADH-quinone oxidoreductase subunit B